MLGHDAEEDEENPDTMFKKIMKVGRDAEKDKRCSDTMLRKIRKIRTQFRKR